MNNDAFIPEGYEPPKGGGGFTKLEDGDNRFRILSSPLMIWLIWTDGKPSRVKFDPNNKPAKGQGQKDSVKHAWNLIVWNYKTEQIEIFELDKQEIISGLATHAKDSDWGHPKNYDIVINKKGTGLDTEYKLVCKPHSPVAQNVVDSFVDTPIDLNQLLVEGGNPFLTSAGSASSTTPAQNTQKVVTPENWVSGDPAPEGYEVKEGRLQKKGMPF